MNLGIIALTVLLDIDTTLSITGPEFVTAKEFQAYILLLTFPIIAAVTGAILIRKARVKTFVLALAIGYLFLYLIAVWMFGWDLNVALES